MSKVDEIIDAMPEEAKDVFLQVLKSRKPNGSGFVVSGPKVCDLLKEHTSFSIGKDAINDWRKNNV